MKPLQIPPEDIISVTKRFTQEHATIDKGGLQSQTQSSQSKSSQPVINNKNTGGVVGGGGVDCVDITEEEAMRIVERGLRTFKTKRAN